MTDIDRRRGEWQTAHFEFWNHERVLHGRDATGFIKAEHYIAALEQELKARECCGNCKNYRAYGRFCHVHDDLAIPPSDHCHFDESRWTRREEP